MNPGSGVFITFEGIEGCGKSTQARRLVERLRESGVIRPALKDGKWVVCDRFFDATTVYQGYARGLDMDMIRSLNDQASWGLKPDVTVLLDCPVEVGLNRAIQRIQNEQQEGQDRFERETLAFHRKVKTGYMGLAETEAERFVVVDGTLGEDELESVIFEKIRHLVP